MEGAMIRGPFAACEGSTVKMGAKIYGATTIGPYCRVGGEINNAQRSLDVIIPHRRIEVTEAQTRADQ